MSTPTIKMPVARANLAIKRGTTFNPVLHVTNRQTGVPIDYTGYTALLEFLTAMDATTALKELTTANGGMVVGNGIVQPVISAADTEALTFSKAFFNLNLISPTGTVLCLVTGTAIVEY